MHHIYSPIANHFFNYKEDLIQVTSEFHLTLSPSQGTKLSDSLL